MSKCVHVNGVSAYVVSTWLVLCVCKCGVTTCVVSAWVGAVCACVECLWVEGKCERAKQHT